MPLENSISEETLNFARPKDAFRENPTPNILTLVLETAFSNRSREDLLDELMALKAMRDEGSERGDSASMKVGSIGDSELRCENIDDDTALHGEKAAKRTLESRGPWISW